MKKTVFIFTILLLSSCINYTKHVSNICPVHKIAMVKVTKSLKFGFIGGGYSTPDVPYGSYCVDGGCVVTPEKLAIAYLCPECYKINKKKEKEERIAKKSRNKQMRIMRKMRHKEEKSKEKHYYRKPNKTSAAGIGASSLRSSYCG